MISLEGRAGCEVSWLWEGRVPRGKVSLVVGDPDAGKSFLMLDLAARVTRGEGVPPEGGIDLPGRVLLLCADDDLDDTVIPRLRGAGAEMGRVSWLSSFVAGDGRGPSRLLSLARDMDRIEEAAREMGECALVVIDPVAAYLTGMDANSNVEVRRVLWRLGEMAREMNAAVVLVSHHRKAGATSVLYRTIGSLAFTAAARVVLGIVEDPAVRGRRLLLPVKLNLQPGLSGRAFRILGGRVEWDAEPVPLTADELHALVGLVTIDRKAETTEWLKGLLKSGRRPSEEIHALALAEEIPRKLLWAAKNEAGIKAVRDGREGRWYWERREKRDRLFDFHCPVDPALGLWGPPLSPAAGAGKGV